MKLGFNEATCKDCSSLEKDLKLCEEYGFDFIEIRGDMLLDYLVDHTVDDLKDFFKHSKIKPYAINALYVYANMFHPTEADKDRDRELMAYFLVCCEVSKRIGNPYFIIVADLLPNANEVDYPDGEDKVIQDSVRILRKLSAIAERYDVKLCWEPVGSRGCSVKNLELAHRIVRDVDRENVGLAIDSFNLYLNGKMNEFSYIRKVEKEKIFAVHINNCDDKPIGILDHCHRRFVDKGEIDLHNYMENIRATGYDGMVSIETFRPEYWNMAPEEVIPTAYRTTKKLLDDTETLK